MEDEMKLLDSQVEKGPNNTVKVSASWRDRMRRPADVKVTVMTGPGIPEGSRTMLTCDESEILGFLSGMAEIAWEQGWRPAGLDNTLAGVVKTYKIPKE